MKKLTTEQRQVVKDSLTKKFNLPEGLIDTLFKRGLSKKLKGDKEFAKLGKDLDDAFTALRKKAEERKESKPQQDNQQNRDGNEAVADEKTPYHNTRTSQPHSQATISPTNTQ